ncbi:hypothetical protein [Clostridium beijerinckii]|uniref:hypothetical protein n=1 Tax=Clostridium beijerinckii TaxID=1520 RepID=UPI00031642C4|nr:hypothetical protein [Clostridium beijerinckii]
MELNYIRDVLVSITTIITVLGVFIKTLNKFFLETIKSRYKMIPGKQSIFDTVLKSIMVFISTVSALFSVIMVTYSLIKRGSNLNTNELLKLSANIYQFIGFVIAILFYYLIFWTKKVFSRLQRMFIYKIEKKSTESQNRSKKSMCSFEKYIRNILNKIKNVSVRNLNIINIIISTFLGSSSLILILVYAIKGIKKEDMESVFILCLIGMVSLISFIISISLVNVVEMLNSNYIYTIFIEQEIIICRCYLEYDEYYLVLENRNERYISKGKVKEIRKSKGFEIEILRN